MNLGKLLVAGKSIVDGRREISYRVSERVYLPKFISPKNPFAPADKAAPPAVAENPVARPMASDGKKTQKLPVYPATQRSKRAWLHKLNPLSAWRGSLPNEQKSQRPLQAELSLDRVKVVHNDLSDADVEIVPIKSRTASITEESREPVLASANSGDTWNRLSAKFFGIKAA